MNSIQTNGTTNITTQLEIRNKIKLFTHTDFDGIGCAILAKIAFNNNVDIEYCDYPNINQKVSDFIGSDLLSQYSKVYITDISVSPEVAEKINNINSNSLQIKLIDHHKTALHLNVYPWATVKVEENNNLCSGTSLFYEELFHIVPGICLYEFSEIVRKYDTWEWFNKYNDVVPKQYNDLLYILGRERFIDLMINKLTDSFDLKFTELELTLLELRQEEINKYIESKNKSIIKKNINNHNIGIVFAERYTSELGNKLCELNPDIDLIAMINPNYSVSYRTIKDVDVSEYAKLYNGGGHAKAAGSPINDDLRNEIIKLIFNYF